MALRYASWTLFVACCFFAFFIVSAPINYAINIGQPHRGEYGIVWFWMSFYGGIPLIALALLAWLQRRTVSRWMIGVWCLPLFLSVVASSLYWLLT